VLVEPGQKHWLGGQMGSSCRSVGIEKGVRGDRYMMCSVHCGDRVTLDVKINVGESMSSSGLWSCEAASQICQDIGWKDFLIEYTKRMDVTHLSRAIHRTSKAGKQATSVRASCRRQRARTLRWTCRWRDQNDAHSARARRSSPSCGLPAIALVVLLALARMIVRSPTQPALPVKLVG